MDRKFGFLREILAEETIEVLVRAALPGCARVAEVHTDPQRLGDAEVACHLHALVPFDRPQQLCRQVTRPESECVVEMVAVMGGT